MEKFVYFLLGSYMLCGIVLPIWYYYADSKHLFIKNLAGIFNVLMSVGLFITLLMVLINEGMDSYYLNYEGGWVIYASFALIIILALMQKFRQSVYSLLIVSIILMMTVLIIHQYYTPATF